MTEIVGGEPFDPSRPVASALSNGDAEYETTDRFMERMIDEGASPEAAKQATAAHFEFDAARQNARRLLPGWTAQRWQEIMFVMLGFFLAELIGVVLTAPAFHPTEPNAHPTLWGILFFATFLPIIVLMVGSRLACTAKAGKEFRQGYTTLRWLTTNPVEVRDSRGRVIPRGDRRLTSSARYMHAFILIGAACAVLSPAIWILRLAIQ